MTAAAETHAPWLERAVAALAACGDVVGAVAMGSTAATSRVDEWSDHDLAVVVQPGSEPRYRDGSAWLPDRSTIAVRTVEHHGGGIAMYDNGHVVEWGVTSLGGLSEWHAHDYQVLLDRGGVADAMARVAAKPFPANAPPQVNRDVAVFMIALRHGVGRWRRGERISAGMIVRGEAVSALLRAVRAAVPGGEHTVLDRLDGSRRFDRAFPSVGERIVQATALPVEDAALELLRIAVAELGVAEDGVPRRALTALTTRLEWPDFS